MPSSALTRSSHSLPSRCLTWVLVAPPGRHSRPPPGCGPDEPVAPPAELRFRRRRPQRFRPSTPCRSYSVSAITCQCALDVASVARRHGRFLERPGHRQLAVRVPLRKPRSGRHTIHYLNANLERRSVTLDVVVCAVEGKYLDRLVQDRTPKQEALARNCYFTKEPIVCRMLHEMHVPREFSSGRSIARLIQKHWI